ncbi:hypothetical protein [Lentibacillus sp. JNUCC-1]|uniref:hypothetical protein n=1 Tax=Lentibacillus sp. JNUCC-1 TaxID=2654513 RepID=UPI0012E82B65|nr:hypothetical protein [Lentibacillus sp. JNUCC-1]
MNQKLTLKRRSLNIPLARGTLSPVEKEVKRKNELITKSFKRTTDKSFGVCIWFGRNDSR